VVQWKPFLTFQFLISNSQLPEMIRNISSQNLFFALGFLLSTTTIPFAYSESTTCLTVYKNGGAPAVFKSPKCPRWNLFDYNSHPQSTTRCQSAKLQGRRKSQEDRTLCVLDVRIPFPGKLFRILSSVSCSRSFIGRVSYNFMICLVLD
jgi:hypothetical protein